MNNVAPLYLIRNPTMSNISVKLSSTVKRRALEQAIVEHVCNMRVADPAMSVDAAIEVATKLTDKACSRGDLYNSSFKVVEAGIKTAFEAPSVESVAITVENIIADPTALSRLIDGEDDLKLLGDYKVHQVEFNKAKAALIEAITPAVGDAHTTLSELCG